MYTSFYCRFVVSEGGAQTENVKEVQYPFLVMWSDRKEEALWQNFSVPFFTCSVLHGIKNTLFTLIFSCEIRIKNVY